MTETRWIARLRDELKVLPETLAELRMGVADLRAVASRLEALTEVLERTQRHWEVSGAAQFARDVDDAVASVNEELAALRARLPTTAGSALTAMVEQTEASINELAKLAGRLQQAWDPRR